MTIKLLAKILATYSAVLLLGMPIACSLFAIDRSTPETITLTVTSSNTPQQSEAEKRAISHLIHNAFKQKKVPYAMNILFVIGNADLYHRDLERFFLLSDDYSRLS